MPRLDGKVALITGAGTGIGRATAILFAREGARVAIAEMRARISPAMARSRSRPMSPIPTASRARFKTAAGHFARLDVLHNNAGGSTAADDTAVEAPLDEFWRAIKLDLYGTFLGCRFGIPELIKAGGGSVINML